MEAKMEGGDAVGGGEEKVPTAGDKGDENVADEKVGGTEEKAAEAKAPEEEAPEAKTPEEKAPEAKAPEEKAPEEKAPEEKAPEAKAPEEKAPEEKAPEEKAPEEKTPEEKAPEEKALEEKAPEENAPEEKAPEEKGKGEDEEEKQRRREAKGKAPVRQDSGGSEDRVPIATTANSMDLEPDDGTGYRAPVPVDLQTLQEIDKNDESLQRWKQQLLGNVKATRAVKKVTIYAIRVICDGRAAGDIVYENLESPETLLAMRSTPFVLKEASRFKFVIQFLVEGDIVSGLKYINVVYKKGIRVDKTEAMLGSFGPNADPHTVTVPQRGWETTPSGMLGRGSYHAKARFVDDYGKTHLEYEYNFDIKKQW